MQYDTILINGNILSMDHDLNRYRWLAIKDGKIAALGINDDYPTDGKELIDLNGDTVLPGLIDSHLHGTLTGISLASIDFRETKTIDQLLQLLEETVNQAEEGELILGTNLSAESLKEKRLPHAHELDQVSKDHPVLIHHVTMHGCVMNSAALRISKLNVGMDGVNEYRDGSANGIISDDNAYYIGVNNIMANVKEDTVKGYITAFTNALPKKGVTTVHTLDGQDLPQDTPVWYAMRNSHPIHVVNYLETLDVELAKSYGYNRVGGCIALDGSRVMKTMAIHKPYENSGSRGTLYYTDDTIYKFMSEAHKNDMQLSLHVGGERAIDQFIYTLYRVVKEQGFKDLRHRPEHFSMPSKEAIELAVEMKLALPMQPSFTYIWDDPKDSLYVKTLGKERAKRMEPFAEIIKMGGIICGGSDSPVTPCDPLWGIHCAANDPNEFRRVSVTEAIKMFTINGAWAAHEEKEKGSIEIGKNADLVILDRSPYEEPQKIKDIHVIRTMVSGKQVYQRN